MPRALLNNQGGTILNLRSYFALAGAMAWLSIGTAQAEIRLDTIGYAPVAKKLATVETEDSQANFRVLRSSDHASVFEGELQAIEGGDPGTLSVADFSSVTETGEYLLEIEDGESSPAFVIGTNPYDEAFQLVMLGMRLWRCGTEVSAEHDGDLFQHEACHTDDAYLLDTDPAEKRDGTGGWHDAGDYNKYVVNAGVSVGCMLRAWEDFQGAIEATLPSENDSSLPPFLEELRWELDWLLKMQRPDGAVFHKLSTLEFGGFIMPENEHERRYFSDWGTAATADFVAMTAGAARVFEAYDADYAERLRAAARQSHQFLQSHPDDRRPDISAFSTGGYQTRDDDDRLWALAEFWETEGDAAALEQLESKIEALLNPPERQADDNSNRRRRWRRGMHGGFDANWDWSNVKNLALITYLESERSDRNEELVAELKTDLLRVADEIVETTRQHPYGRPLGERYYWGSNGGVARQALVLEAAYRIEAKPKYKQTQASSLHYLFGRNPFGRSMITGIGHQPPMRPHDRRSGGDDVNAPWPGYLVGGPERNATDWHDVEEDYRTNEIAINWNAALIYALASQLKAE